MKTFIQKIVLLFLSTAFLGIACAFIPFLFKNAELGDSVATEIFRLGGIAIVMWLFMVHFENTPVKTNFTAKNTKQKSVNTKVELRDGIMYVNEKQIAMPKNLNTNCIKVINDQIYVGGYEFDYKTESFKITCKSLWYYLV